MNGGAEGTDPILGILLLHSRISMGEEAVGSRTSTDDVGSFQVKQDGFGALGPAVDPESDHGA
jgi:hypothetical protein